MVKEIFEKGEREEKEGGDASEKQRGWQFWRAFDTLNNRRFFYWETDGFDGIFAILKIKI